MARHVFPGARDQGGGLRKGFDRPFDLGVVHHAEAPRLVLAVNHVDEHVADVVLDEITVALGVLLGKFQALSFEETAKRLDRLIVGGEVARHRLVDPEVVLAKLEERAALQEVPAGAARQQFVFDRSVRRLIQLDIGRDASAAEDLAAAVGAVDINARGGALLGRV